MIIVDIITFGGMFISTSLLVWIVNRDINRSVKRSKENHMMLEKKRVEMEERLSKRKHELIKVERSQIQELERTAQFGELSQGLLHDLISPLSSMNLYVEKIDKANIDPDETKEVVEKMINASKRMRYFMSSINHYLRMKKESQENINDPKSCNLMEEATIVQDLLAYKARAAGVELRIKKIPASIFLKTSSLNIQQILMNLLSNAIESYDGIDMHAKIVDVSVKVSLQDVCIISVRDFGKGINESDFANVFSRSYSTKKHGSGLGLHTVKRIVDEMNGEITFVSNKKAGTTFIVSLPI